MRLASAIIAAPLVVLGIGLTGYDTLLNSGVAVLVAFLLGPILVRSMFRRLTKKSAISTSLLLVVAPIACIAMEVVDLPLRLGYALSKDHMEKIDLVLRQGSAVKTPAWVGVVRVRKVEMSHDGITCLWTHLDQSGNSGFVKTTPDVVPFNLWGMVSLDQDWQYITED